MVSSAWHLELEMPGAGEALLRSGGRTWRQGWSEGEVAAAGHSACHSRGPRTPQSRGQLVHACVFQAEDLQFSGSALKCWRPPKMQAPLAWECAGNSSRKGPMPSLGSCQQ